MTITTTRLYQILSDQLSKETAESLTNYIEEKVKEDIDSRSNIFLTQKDKTDLLDKMNIYKIDIIARLNKNFLILLSTMLAMGGTLIVIAINISNKVS